MGEELSAAERRLRLAGYVRDARAWRERGPKDRVGTEDLLVRALELSMRGDRGEPAEPFPWPEGIVWPA